MYSRSEFNILYPNNPWFFCLKLLLSSNRHSIAISSSPHFSNLFQMNAVNNFFANYIGTFEQLLDNRWQIAEHFFCHYFFSKVRGATNASSSFFAIVLKLPGSIANNNSNKDNHICYCSTFCILSIHNDEQLRKYKCRNCNHPPPIII